MSLVDIPLVDTLDQVLSAFIIWLFGFLIAEKVRRKFAVRYKLAYALYIWHSFFCIVYTIYVQNNLGDALFYYQDIKAGEVIFGFGTEFIKFFAALFIIPLHLSFLGIFLVFNIFGYLGLLAWQGSLNILTKGKPLFIKRLALIVVFLPSVSFWSSALGKDSLAFMATGFALWAALNLKKRILLMVFSILVMSMIRPHIAGIMIISLSIAIIFEKKTHLSSKFILSILTITAVSIMVPFALQYAGLENITQEGVVSGYIEKRQSYNLQGGGGIDISSMSLPVQMYTYAFRPMPFEAHSFSAFMASLDNMFLFVLFLLFLKGFYKKRKRYNQYNMAFIISFIVATWLILALTTANLGIAIRQKWMFMPFLVFLFFLYIDKQKKSNVI